MKSFKLLLLCLMYIVNSYGQIDTSSGHVVVEFTIDRDAISTKAEIMSAFPGGDSSWTQSLENNLNQIRLGTTPKKGKYIVSVQFNVDKDGRFANIYCKRDPGFGLCQEVVRVIMKSDKKSPLKVRPYHRSSITFQLKD